MKKGVRLPTALDRQNNPLSREKLIQAVTVSLLLDEEAGIAMAGCDVAKFVLTAGPIMRKFSDLWDYRFTDDDMREVHWHLRRHVASLARRKGLPVLRMEHGRIPGLTTR